MTALDALIAALAASARYDPAFQTRPEAVLWCDPERSFAPIVPLLRDRMPYLLTLGGWDPPTRSAPAFQLRVAASHAEIEGAAVPILWLPGVGRETLRDAGACPHDLEPLVWLVASGVLFGHINGKDWTLRGFLTSERGPVKLDIADGAEAREALALAAPKLMLQEIETLRTRRFDAETLHAIVAPDLADEVLAWMEGRRTAEAEPAWFRAFAQRTIKNLGFDPRKRTRQEAIRAMAERADRWAPIWSRYEASATESFPATTAQLLREEPPGVFGEEETFPQANLKAEEALRDALQAMGSLLAPEARARLLSLERQHGHRRQTLWGRRGQAPLASTLEHLVVVALASPCSSDDPSGVAKHYAEAGAAVDGAAARALAAAPKPDDRAAVTAALRAVYLPWLDEGARALQALAAKGAIPFGAVEPVPDAVDAMVFVDGLRFDLAQRLVANLRSAGAHVALSWRWSGFPTSTACCKPLVSPVAGSLTGVGGESALIPIMPDGKPADHRALIKAMAPLGYGTAPDAERVWSEVGSFDDDGHKLGVRLVDQMERGVEDAARAILALAQAGRRVRVVTDHGWLLMPGGLETAKLGAGLTEPDEKRARYARLKEGATTKHTQAAWSWNPSVRLAMAPGATSFYAGQEYAHGGVSPQECVVPVIDVEPMAMEARAEIKDVKWLSMRLRVQTSDATDMTVDLRRADAVSGPSLAAKAVTVGEDGKASLMALDVHEGIAAMVVVLDDQGRILARRSVTVGG